MSFIQSEFVAFFAAVCAIRWVLPGVRARNVFLLLASYLFYGWANPALVALLLAVTGVNYLGAWAISRWSRRGAAILTLVTVASITNLAAFKYFGWFAEDIAPLVFSADRVGALRAMNVVVPLGLSFYTFHNLSYTIDVYRGRVALRTNLVDYLLFGSYFPQLVAGPVERAGNVLPQLEKPIGFDPARFASGLGLALWGAFKKVVIADAIAPYVDLMFGLEDASWAIVWASTLGFSIQVLADFSGYTDIARGTSRMLGIELMENFTAPYLAATPMEFWQRWHISLSTWLRDYVYLPVVFSSWVRRWVRIPFTGEWGGFGNGSRALLVTMLVSGLWHGSTVKFLLWGVYHFVIITAYTVVMSLLPRGLRRQAGWRWLTVPLMFGWTLIGMHMWREVSVARILRNFTLDPFAGSEAQTIVAASMLGVCLYAAAPLLLGLLYDRAIHPRVDGSRVQVVLRSVGWTLIVMAILASAPEPGGEFIYFQF